MSTPEQRAEWRRLEQAATPGEWSTEIEEYGDSGSVEIPEIGRLLHDTEWANPEDFQRDQDNAEFIAASRTAVPALLDDVERLEAENTLLKMALTRVTDQTTSNNEKLEGIQRNVGVIMGDRVCLEAENAQLRAELREALLEIAGTPPESLWEMEDPRMTYVTIQVDKKDYAAAQKRLEELEERA